MIRPAALWHAARVVGRAIVLVGVSSVGKSTLVDELQRRLPDPWLHVGIDHFFSMFPYEWRDHPRGPGPGFWVERSTDDDGSPRARIRYGDAGERLLAGMRASVNALLAAGNDVLLDEMPVDASVVPAWRRDLRARSVRWVRLTASLPVLEERERGRVRSQVLGNARGHLDVEVGDGWDLVVDTDGLTPAEVADRVLAALAPSSG
ncbi:MAG: hypothetical protein CMH83_09185 [Nocardioides sp.]|nr:hypothetical protein [Nocardioides sp.]